MAKKLQLIVSGFELNATCHILTMKQSLRLIEIQKKNPKGNLSSIGYEIEQILQGFYLFQDNAWSISKPLINDALSFRLLDENENIIENFSLKQMTNILDVNHKIKLEKYVILPNKSKENILLYYEENKGDVCSFNIISDDVPAPKEFSYMKGKMQTPDGYFEYIASVFYNEEELMISYDYQDVDGKTSFMKLWMPD